MISTNETRISRDPSGKKLLVTREFNAPVDMVWNAFTQSDLLDKWWAPKPWKAETKSMDFKEGGSWLYAMVGPEGEKHWSRVDYKAIDPQKSYTAKDAFCDENGTPSGEMPSMTWETRFEGSDEGTQFSVNITFDNEADLKTIVEMGFEEGFTQGLDQLDKLLAEQ